ncbi:condensation domain-containing protein, partial [Actinocrispum wychmicini]
MEHGDMLMLPSSVTQQRLYLLFRSNPDSHAYNVTVPLAIDGVLPVGQWRAAIDAIVSRHEALRTTLRLVDGRVFQCVAAGPRVTFETMEFEDESDPLLLDALRECRTRPFDLERGPLMRCLVATGPSRQKVVICIHHSVCDGISVSIILRELRQLLATPDADLPLPDLQFADYAAWEEAALDGPRMSAQVAEWVDALSGVANPHRLPLDGPRTPDSVVPAGHASFVIERERCEQVRQLAKSLRCSEFSVYMGLVQLWLHKTTGDRKVAVGVPVGNRPDSQLDNVVGCFANTFAIPFDADRTTTVAECVKAASRWLRKALAEQSVPFDQVVSGLRANSSLGHAAGERWSPVFQVSLTYHDTPLDLTPIVGRPVTALDLDGATAKFDLDIGVSWQDEELHGTVLYNGDLFTEATVRHRLDYLTELLTIMVDTPQMRIVDVPAVSAAERDVVLGFGGGVVGDGLGLGVVHGLFEGWVD